MDLNAFSLAGKVAIVTGSGRGIGRGIALGLAGAGADIVVAELNSEWADRTAAEVEALGKRALAIPTDVTNRDSVEQMVEQAIAAFSRVDILVNNAGGMAGVRPNPVLEMSDADYDRVATLNSRAAFLCSTSLARRMIANNWGGSIVNIASIAGLAGAENIAPYAFAKAGLINLTRTLCNEWGPKGIRVNAVAPGSIVTPASQRRASPERDQANIESTPLRRLGQPEDIAGVVMFLCSDAASFVSGQVIAADGGRIAAGRLSNIPRSRAGE